MAELIYRNVKNLPAVESKDDMNESDAIIVVQDETTKQATFADVRDAIIDLIDYSDVGADPVGSADDALATAKAYTDREINALNTSLSEDIADNASAIQDLTTYADDTFETKTEATQSHTDILNTVTSTYATKTENAKTLTDAKAYTDQEIDALNTSVANTYATKTENAKTLTDAKAYTDREIDALNTSVTATYATKTENSQSLTDAKAYTDTEINKLDTSVANTYATKTENAKTLTDAKDYTDAALTDLVGTAPDKLNTLGEIADALKGNADIVDTIISQIPTKVSQLTNDSGYVTANTDITGNAATATKLQTARTIALTGSVTGSGTFDGSGNLSIETTTNHTHNYAGSTSAGGAATKAISDSAGQQIDTTYIKELSVSGATVTITKGDGSTSTITTQDTNTDTKVTNTLATTTKAYVTGTTSATTNTGTQVFDTGVYLDEEAGTLTATTFNGDLSGNASTATKATQDSAGQQINTTYIKGLSISGTTLTITKGDGSTSTITTQDTNTDTKVTNTLATTTKAYVTGTTSATTNTGTQVFDTGVYLDTTAGMLTAKTFKGDLSGNATTATSAHHLTAIIAGNIGSNKQGKYYYIGSITSSSTSWTGYTTRLAFYDAVGYTNNGELLITARHHGTDDKWTRVGVYVENYTYLDYRKSFHLIETSSTELQLWVEIKSGDYWDPRLYHVYGNELTLASDPTVVYDSLPEGTDHVGERTYYGDLSGNASTATKLATTRTIALTGSVTGSGTFDGSGNLSIATTTNHTHSYLPLAGGTMTGTINSSKTASTILAGNQGAAIINSTASPESYTMLAKMNSTHGYFTMGMHQANYLLLYTEKSTVDAETNSVTKSATLLDESGNTSFPGTVSAGVLNGVLYTSGNRTSFVNNQFTAGEALAVNDLIILDASTGTWFKSTTARTYAGVAMVATARATCASGATVYADVGMQRTVTAATVGNLAANNLVLIQGTLGDDGVSFTTDGTITNTRIEGKEYIRAGYLQTETSIIFSGTNPQILTWGSGGGGSIDPETLEKLVTTDAEQTITGSKTFSGTNYVTGKMQQSGAFTDYTTYRFRNTAMGTSSTPTTDATYGGSGSIYIQYS